MTPTRRGAADRHVPAVAALAAALAEIEAVDVSGPAGIVTGTAFRRNHLEWYTSKEAAILAALAAAGYELRPAGALRAALEEIRTAVHHAPPIDDDTAWRNRMDALLDAALAAEQEGAK